MAIQPRYKFEVNPETGKREPAYERNKGGIPRLDKNGKPRRKVLNYKVEVYRTDPVTGKQARRVVGTYAKWEDADKANTSAKEAIQNGTFEWDGPAPGLPTVSEAAALWIDTKAMQVTSNSLIGYRAAAEKYVIPAWGSLHVDEVTYAIVQQQVNEWDKEGKGAQIINRAVLVLRGLLDMQVRSGAIQANAATGIVKPSVNQNREIAIWDDAQLARFLDAARSHHLAPLWFLLALEGMRRSEALALYWSDVQWNDDRATVTIQRTLVPDLSNGGAAILQGRTKTKGSRRSVLLTSQTTEVLLLHRDRQKFLRNDIGENWAAGDAIVATSIGTYVNPSTVRRQLHTLIEICNLVDPSVLTDGMTKRSERVYVPEHQQLPKITTHTLRHMAATKMLQGGAPLHVVQAKLGHADVRMTADRYGHLEDRDQLAAAEATERAVVRGAGGTTG